MLRFLPTALIFATSCLAQIVIQPWQIRCNAAPGRIYVAASLPGAPRLTCVQFDTASFGMDSTTNPPTLRFLGPPDFLPTVTNGVLSIRPGRIRFGTMSCTNLWQNQVSFAIQSMDPNSGIAKLYIASSCAIVIQYPSALTNVVWGTPVGQITAQPVATPTVPSDCWYIGEINIGPVGMTQVTDKRGWIGMDAWRSGYGFLIDCTLGVCLAGVDPATVPNMGGTNVWTGPNSFVGPVFPPPSTFANLVQPSGPTSVWCQDCMPASSPCVGGGAGAWAFWTSGNSWVCPF